MKLKKELPWTNIIDTPYFGYQVYDHDEHKYFWIFTTKDHIKELEQVFRNIDFVYSNCQMYLNDDDYENDSDYWAEAVNEWHRMMNDVKGHLPDYIIITDFMDAESFEEVWPEQEEPDPDDPYYDEYDYQDYLYREDGSKIRYNVITHEGKTYEIEILDDKDVSM